MVVRKKILIVFGTRPEAIKMAPVVTELLKSQKLEVKVCVTAQHREMLDQVLSLFNIEPDYDLDIMKKGQDLFDVTVRILENLKKVISDYKPNLIIVHGDTTTSFTSALAGFYSGTAIAHVEAGLRTYNLQAPWPEEANRQLTGRLTKYHFAPTDKAKQNLEHEHIESKKILVTGNTVIDALLLVKEKIGSEKGNTARSLLKKSGYTIPKGKKVILVTGHRRENFGEGFLNICSAIEKIAVNNPDVDIVYPVHLNPNVQEPVMKLLKGHKNIYLIAPLDYLPFVYLMMNSYLVVTDSGGIQEEAPALGKPVLVMRETTERPEAVDAGTVVLVGTDSEKIYKGVDELLYNNDLYKKMSLSHNPYGDGQASSRIRQFLEENEL
jgi:UDP-N-acetylglucosamine 2-epimerase (non-hydrolysing)